MGDGGWDGMDGMDGMWDHEIMGSWYNEMMEWMMDAVMDGDEG